MPDKELDDLLLELGGEPKDPSAEPQDPVDPVEPEPQDPEDPAEPNPETGKESDPVPPKATPPAPKDDPNKAARAFAEMRTKATQYEKLMDKAAKASGLTRDEFIAKLETDALNKRAEESKIPADALRRIEELEQRLQASESAKVQTHLAKEFANVQTKFGISDAELTTFTETLANRGFNFEDTSVDYSTLYRGMNYEALVEKERQSWIAGSARAGAQGSRPIIKNGKGGPSGSEEITSFGDLDAALEGLPQ